MELAQMNHKNLEVGSMLKTMIERKRLVAELFSTRNVVAFMITLPLADRFGPIGLDLYNCVSSIFKACWERKMYNGACLAGS
jgi:hypothetical protein